MLTKLLLAIVLLWCILHQCVYCRSNVECIIYSVNICIRLLCDRVTCVVQLAKDPAYIREALLAGSAALVHLHQCAR